MSATVKVAVKGPGLKYGRPDKPNTGPWGDLKDGSGQPRNWRGLIFDGVKDGSGKIVSANATALGAKAPASSAYEFDLSRPDDRHAIYHPEVKCFLGVDATKHSTDVQKPGVISGSNQFYLKPEAETRGGYESPVVYEGNLTPKLLSGQVEYNSADEGLGVSCAFVVEVL